MSADIILVIVVGTALAFDFTNGFHDTANVVATSISTHAMPPRLAVSYAAIFNFTGAFISLAVAATVAKDVVNADVITPTVVFAGLVGVIAINLVYGIVGRERPGPVNRGFRLGQVVSGGMLALAHGTNDAQKTMGVIALALVTNGNLAEGADPPTWVIVSAASAIALGTYSGGWRIIRTMGTRIIRMDAAQGFSASGAGAGVILASSPFGFPLSTTHVISGGVTGAGAGKRLSAVRWGVAGDIVTAWLMTLPAAAAVGAVTYGVTRVFGTGWLGPAIVAAIALAFVASAFVRRGRRGAPVPPPRAMLSSIVDT